MANCKVGSGGLFWDPEKGRWEFRATGLKKVLPPTLVKYIEARNKAMSLVAANDKDANAFGRNGHSGAFHTPVSVIDAVRAWKQAAIDFAEEMGKEYA